MVNPRNEAAGRSPHAKRRSVLLAQSWWEERVLRGVGDYASKHNWELQCRMHWTHQLPKLADWRGDGIIVFAGISPALRKAGRSLIRFVRGANVPVVETQPLGNYFNSPKVIVPHDAVGRIAADYFLGLNFRHLAYVAFEENPLEHARREGFRLAAEGAGATFHALSPRTLARTMAQLPKPMGLLAANDANALELLPLFLDAGFRVPEEFAIMGIDDSEIVCDLAAVPLSSVNCDYERQGYEAAALLDRLMDGAPAPKAPTVVQPRGVTVRRSTDTIAIPDLDTARVLRALRDHYRERRSVQLITGDVGVPLRRVQTLFREHVGHTMIEELTRLRVEHAKTLLRDPKLKLETVALESGFSSRFHFVAAFKRVTGKTPKSHRALALAETKTAARAR